MQQQTYTPGFAPEVLPCELERMIFELAVRERQTMGGGILDILLVCNRVREWTEAIIYESLIFDASLLTIRLLLRTLASKTSKTGGRQFFERTVKRVYLGPIMSAEEAAFVISLCTGATEIVSWAPEIETKPYGLRRTPSLNYFECNSALQRLAVRPNDIFGQPDIVDFSPSYSSLPPHTTWALHLAQILANITHLCIINPSEPADLVAIDSCSPNSYPADYDALLYMPSLTHVVFGKLWIRRHKILFPFFSRMLGAPAGNEPSNSLQSLLLISSEPAFINHLKQWHECDARLDNRLTLGKEYDYRTMARIGWIHTL